MNIEQWLRIDPFDTLFFKGAEPMIAGVSHEVRTVFPPMPATVIGATRTAILCQRGIEPQDYAKGKATETMARYPALGSPDKPGFQLVGPLLEVLMKNGGSQVFFPASAQWFADLEEKRPGNILSVMSASPMAEAMAELGLASSVPNPLYVFNPSGDGLKSLAGFWVNGAAFSTMKSGKGRLTLLEKLDDIGVEPAMLPLSAFYAVEERVGIALEPGLRRVRQGHLYGTTHARLHTGIRLMAGVTPALAPAALDKTGVLQLGGERRMAGYECLDADAVSFPKAGNDWAVALMPIPWSDFAGSSLAGLPRASGPLVRMGGWDMKEGFHKPTTAHLPAGAAIRITGQETIPFGFITV